MAFLITPFVQLPQLSELRNGWDCVPIGAYIPLFTLYMYLLNESYKFPPYKSRNATVLLYTNHMYWYLSIWNYIVQMIFLLLSFIDILLFLVRFDLHWQKRVYKLRYYIFHGFIVPVSTVVGLVFCPSYVFPSSRRVMLPKELLEVVPLWMFFILHGAIFYPFFVEHILFTPLMQIQWNIPFCIFLSVYWMHVVLCLYFYFINEQWLYPVFNYTNKMEAFEIIGEVFLIGLVSLCVSIRLHNFRRRLVPRGRTLEEVLD